MRCHNLFFAIINVSEIRPAAMSVEAITGFLWDAEPDFYGLNNLTEYALGGNPMLGNDGVDPAHGFLGDSFAIEYNRRRDAAARGLSYRVMANDDLVNPDWSSNGIADVGSEIVDANFESVTNSVSTIGKTNEFLKLDVEFQK